MSRAAARESTPFIQTAPIEFSGVDARSVLGRTSHPSSWMSGPPVRMSSDGGFLQNTMGLFGASVIK